MADRYSPRCLKNTEGQPLVATQSTLKPAQLPGPLSPYPTRPVFKILDEQAQQLKALIRRRKQIVKMINAENNRLLQAPNTLAQDIKEHIQFLKFQLKKIDSDINKHISLHEKWKNIQKILQSVPGIGAVTSTSIIVELPELGHLNRKKIAALVGVAPFNKDSGNFKGQKSVWGGRADIRATLYMATLSAIRFNPIIKNFYNRLIQKGKIKKVAIVACMRKLITILNAMVKKDELWNPKPNLILDN